MDNEQLRQWKMLANDAIIATFGIDSREAQLALALERATKAIDDFDAMVDKVAALEEENEELRLESADLRDIHTQIQEHLSDVEGAVTAIETALWEDRDAEINELKEHLKKLAADIKELGDEL